MEARRGDEGEARQGSLWDDASVAPRALPRPQLPSRQAALSLCSFCWPAPGSGFGNTTFY